MNVPLPPHSGDCRRHDPDEAATWLARRDRGLTPDEQVTFERWLADRANARAWQEIEGPFAALDRAAQLRPRDAAAPDPDLLLRNATRSEHSATWGLLLGGVAAAALVFGLFTAEPAPEKADPAPPHRLVVRNAPERLTLPDGSVVELKAGTAIEPVFTAMERRIRLPGGEAHFTVARDSLRPFVVVVGKVEVRAVGTAFSIHASGDAVEVVVTEGRVRVDDTDGRNLVAPAGPSEAAPSALDAGQFVVIPVAPAAAVPVPALPATPAVLNRTAEWRSAWLEFGDSPLADVVREFNRHGARQSNLVLKVADEATGRVLVSGAFRADSAATFVRLLQTSFGIHANHGTDGSVVLRGAE